MFAWILHLWMSFISLFTSSRSENIHPGTPLVSYPHNVDLESGSVLDLQVDYFKRPAPTPPGSPLLGSFSRSRPTSPAPSSVSSATIKANPTTISECPADSTIAPQKQRRHGLALAKAAPSPLQVCFPHTSPRKASPPKPTVTPEEKRLKRQGRFNGTPRADGNSEDQHTTIEDSLSEYSMPTLQEPESKSPTIFVTATISPRIAPPSPLSKQHRRGLGFDEEIAWSHHPAREIGLVTPSRTPPADTVVDQATLVSSSSSDVDIGQQLLSFPKVPSFIPSVPNTPPIPASFPQSMSVVSLASSSPSIISMSLSESSLASTPKRGRAVISALRGLLDDGEEEDMNARRLFDRESKWSMRSKVSIRSRKRRSSDVMLPSLPSLPIVTSIEGTEVDAGYATPQRKRPMPIGRMPKDSTPFARNSATTSLVRNGTLTRNGSITGTAAAAASRKSVIRLTMSASKEQVSWQALPSSTTIASLTTESVETLEQTVGGISRMTLNISPEEWDELEELIGQLKVEFPDLMRMRMSMKAAKRLSKESHYEFQVENIA